MIASPAIDQQAPVNYVVGDGIGIAKRTSGLLGAGIVTLGLLFAMTQLISNDLPVLEEERPIVIPSINFIPEDAPPEVIEIVRPVVKEQPKITKTDYSQSNEFDDAVININTEVAKIDIDVGGGIGLPGGMALVPISPQYPEIAASRGLCGYAVMQWDITADGIPTNVVVLESSSRLFNKSAIRAVERARYKPHIEGGKAAMVRGKQEKITYQLEGGC